MKGENGETRSMITSANAFSSVYYKKYKRSWTGERRNTQNYWQCRHLSLLFHIVLGWWIPSLWSRPSSTTEICIIRWCCLQEMHSDTVSIASWQYVLIWGTNPLAYDISGDVGIAFIQLWGRRTRLAPKQGQLLQPGQNLLCWCTMGTLLEGTAAAPWLSNLGQKKWSSVSLRIKDRLVQESSSPAITLHLALGLHGRFGTCMSWCQNRDLVKGVGVCHSSFCFIVWTSTSHGPGEELPQCSSWSM